MEGRPKIRAMLEATLEQVQPSNWAIEGEVSEAGGVVDARITFETGVARGRGQLRLKDGLCWTLLTTMVELKGFEEKRVRIALQALSMALSLDARVGPSCAPKRKACWGVSADAILTQAAENS